MTFLLAPLLAALSPDWFEAFGPLLLVVAAVAVVALLTVLLSVFRSIRGLRDAAERLAQGDLSQRVHISGPLQIDELSESLNCMARQLDERMATVVQQRNELTAVLSSMVEGVLAVDVDERIISMNPAAAEMLRLEASRSIGRPIQELIRNTAIQRFITQTLRQELDGRSGVILKLAPARYSIAAEQREERFFQAQSALLRDGTGRRLGAVLVLHDVTHLRRLEQVRTDFVANVSHEIRTPCSAVKAAVETLLDDPTADPETSLRFLRMIARQADRLDAIVSDLLSLSQIEQAAGKTANELDPVRIRGVLENAIETCNARARVKQTTVTLECPESLRAMVQTQVLEQAVVNLIDNAIKYSPERTTVRVIAVEQEGEIVVSVADEGRGIEPDHLPRIFERFYRTDKARSRDLGGTGLGLSIVKHAAEAMGGRVSVDSFPGSGSVFAMHLRPGKARDASPAFSRNGVLPTDEPINNEPPALPHPDGLAARRERAMHA